MTDKYAAEIYHWCRSHDGDDWITSSYHKNFNTLEEAREYVYSLSGKDLIEATVWTIEGGYLRNRIEKHDYTATKEANDV